MLYTPRHFLRAVHTIKHNTFNSDYSCRLEKMERFTCLAPASWPARSTLSCVSSPLLVAARRQAKPTVEMLTDEINHVKKDLGNQVAQVKSEVGQMRQVYTASRRPTTLPLEALERQAVDNIAPGRAHVAWWWWWWRSAAC